MGFDVSCDEKVEGRDCCREEKLGTSGHEDDKCGDLINNMEDDYVELSDGEDCDPLKQVKGVTNAFLKKPPNGNGIKRSMRNEILQLEERLQDQFVMRRALENALGYRTSTLETPKENLMPKPTKKLIKEISVLELEVMYLERYLLSLYRKAFHQQAFTSSPHGEKHMPSSPQPEMPFHEMSKEPPCEQDQTPPLKPSSNMFNKRTKPERTLEPSWNLKCRPSNKSSSTARPNVPKGLGVLRSRSELSHRAVCSAMASLCEASGPDVYRSHSSLSEQAVCSDLLTSLDECVDDSMLLRHSEPLSFVEEDRNANSSQIISLAEFLGTRIADHVPETLNRLSEDMIRCMGSIYCKFAESPLLYHGATSSTASSSSSSSGISTQYVAGTWSPGCKKDASLDVRLENPFQLEGLKERNGPCNTWIEVANICPDTQKLREVEDLLKMFKSLLQRLEKMDPRKLKQEEKLAFWINVHNALVMHAYAQGGIPQNYLRRIAMLQKVRCKIGGRMVNINTIRSYILGHRIQYPGQWLRALLHPKLKLRGREDWQSYAIGHSEPLLHFALCLGNRSDPVVRIYSPKRVYKMLETAKEEYIRATVSIRKEEKILLPKLLESYARESKLTPSETMDIIERNLPETLRIAIHRCRTGRSSYKFMEWVPHNFDFRYLLLRELSCPILN